MAGQVTGRFITRPEPGTTRATWQRGPLLGIVNLKLTTARPLAVRWPASSSSGTPRVSLWHERRVLRATFRWLLPVAAMIVAQWYSGMRGRCLVLPHAPVGASHGSLRPGSFYGAVESEPVARPADCRRPAFGFGRARLSARQLECDRESDLPIALPLLILILL